MKSIIFEEYTERSLEVKKARKRLLEIINTFPKWEQCETLEITKKIYPGWKMESSLVYEVQRLGFEIGDQTMDCSRPIKSINANIFSAEEYALLKVLGYSESAIYTAMKKSKMQFERYKISRKFPMMKRRKKVEQ